MQLIAFFAVISLAVGTYVMVASSSARRRRAILRRQPLSVRELYSRYFAGRGLEEEAVGRHWRECAARLGLSPELLRPSDTFDQELKSLQWLDPFDDRKDDLAKYALGEARKCRTTLDLDSMHTLDDLVAALARLEGSAADRSPV
jgi:hypothetical protein